MATWVQRIIFNVADLRRQVWQICRPGTVDQVQGDKLRLILGYDTKGKPFYSPWIDTHNQRGGATERRFYKKGQTCFFLSPGGDLSQGFIMANAPNQDNPPPAHADKAGAESETYQLDTLRVRKDKDTYDIWLQDDTKDESPGEGKKASVKIRLNKDGGITGRIGTDIRYQVTKDGAKFETGGGQHWASVESKGPFLRMSEPWVIAPTDVINDDK